MSITRYLGALSLTIIIFASGFVASDARAADECESTKTLKQLSNKKAGPDLRSQWATCLVKNHLSNARVSQEILKILMNEEEHLFVKEDILGALSQISFRKSVKMDQQITKEITKEEAHAVDRTVASAKNILDVTNAVKTMNDMVPLTTYENDYVAALSNILTNDRAEVELRIGAVQALSNIVQSMIDSGMYDEKLLLTVYDVFHRTSLQDDAGSYYSGAQTAYHKLQNLFQKYAFNPNKYGAKQGRQISSITR